MHFICKSNSLIPTVHLQQVGPHEVWTNDAFAQKSTDHATNSNIHTEKISVAWTVNV